MISPSLFLWLLVAVAALVRSLPLILEMFFSCAFAFLCWEIVKNSSETKEHQKKSNLYN